MRVLVAEDKPRMARFLQRALQSEGYSVELAFDGEQALSMGLSGGLDLMVLDVMLPRRDGFDVIRNLRAAKQMLPTIMVSARDAKSDIVRGLDLGADDYLTKPFALDVLLARVRALTRRWHSSALPTRSVSVAIKASSSSMCFTRSGGLAKRASSCHSG